MSALWPDIDAPLLSVSTAYLPLAAAVGAAVGAAIYALMRRGRPDDVIVEDASASGDAAAALATAPDAASAGRLLVGAAERAVAADAVCLVLTTDGGRGARGLAGRADGVELDWVPGVTLDLERDPSGVGSAARDAAPLTVYDLAASKARGAISDRLGAKSAAYVPVIGAGRVLAVLVVASTRERRAFTSDELSTLQRLAAEAAPPLARAAPTAPAVADPGRVERLLDENRRRLKQQSALLRAAQVLSSDLQLEAVLQRLVEQVAVLLEADAADCYVFDADRHVLRCEAVHGLPQELVGFEFPAARGVAADVIREGRAVIVGDYGELARPIPHDAYADFTSAVVAPMRWSGRVQGVLGVGARGDRAFDDEDRELLEAYAGLASLALANARAYDERTRQERVQRGFFRIASALAQTLSLTETLEAVAQAANEALGGSFACVLMPRAGALELAGAAAFPATLQTALDSGLPGSAEALASAAADGRVLASPDVVEDDRFDREWAALATQAGYRSLLAVPIADPREEAHGLVIVFFAETRTFADEDLELARNLGDAARGALERSELFEAERTARALSQQLARTGGVLATELDPAAVLDEVVQQAPALLGADACAIRTVEGDELVIAAAAGEELEAAVGTRAPSTVWLSGDVFQSRSPVAIEDASRDDRLVAADPILGSGYSAFLGVPLAGPEGTLHGVLAVYARRPRRWRPEEVEALLALAANTSAALSNADLYSRVSLEKEQSVAILANIADGIVAVDRDGHVVLWNAAAEEVTGVPQDEALGRTLPQVLQRSFEGDGAGAPGPRLVSILRGGEEIWLSLSEAVMRDPLGGVAGRIFAFRDISADRMVEEVKSDFVAAVSHELRTPLTSIYGFAETLLRRDVLFGEEERRTFLGYIASESERLTEIVDQLLNVARLDAGDLQVEPERIDVGAVVSEVVETAEESGIVDGHRFELDLPDEPLAAEADRDKVRQVFSILVENALKYSPDGGTVTVGARRKDDAVEVRVVDEGIGIPATERERIFRKFYRAESTTRDGAAGTGLGLFIAKELVTAMGGRIWVDSAEGEGSSFAFELPAARE